MSQRYKAEKKVKHAHGGHWGDPRGRHGDGAVEAQLKAHRAEAKKSKRARRRLDKAIIEEEMEMKDDRKLGPTGKHPEGKLHEGDRGELRAALGIRGGRVYIDFGTNLSWVAMRPDEARALAKSLMQKADKAEKMSE